MAANATNYRGRFLSIRRAVGGYNRGMMGSESTDDVPSGIVIVDHGSRREESNLMLERVAERFAQRFLGKYSIVEPAHMELAEPSIATAFARCMQRGAKR